jgi:2-keto-3-deoxy-6-phosphogluconate aldolase
MSDKKEIIDRILSEKLISIIRVQEQTAVQPTVDALVAGGIQVLEITTKS